MQNPIGRTFFPIWYSYLVQSRKKDPEDGELIFLEFDEIWHITITKVLGRITAVVVQIFQVKRALATWFTHSRIESSSSLLFVLTYFPLNDIKNT